MELVKPEPLVIGGRAHYTLTSYDPVSIDVDVPYTTEEDVEYALQVTVAQAGGGPAQLNDDAWMREQFEDVSGVDEMRACVAAGFDLQRSADVPMAASEHDQ